MSKHILVFAVVVAAIPILGMTQSANATPETHDDDLVSHEHNHSENVSGHHTQSLQREFTVYHYAGECGFGKKSCFEQLLEGKLYCPDTGERAPQADCDQGKHVCYWSHYHRR